MSAVDLLDDRPAVTPAEVRLSLLQGFELTVDGAPQDLPPSAQRLVAFLALQARPVVRSHVAGVLWGNRSDARAAACLRSAIWRINTGHGAAVVNAGRSRLLLDPGVVVDVRDAAALAHQQLAGGGAAADPGLLRGELLPGWYDDWVLVERERLRQLCLEAMEQMAESLLTAGHPRLAIEAALGVVATEPLRESAYRVLIDAHVAAGNRGEALRQFDRCRTTLRQELGLAPGDALVAAAARAHGPAAVVRGAQAALAAAGAVEA